MAVASSLQAPFQELKNAYCKATGNAILETTGSSGGLTAQILNGAPYDLFFSADVEYPEKLHEQGLTTGAPQVYAYGRLILWSVREITQGSVEEALLSPEVRKVAIANPKVAPYGRESWRVIEKLNLVEQVKDKLVYGESIAQVNNFVFTGAADVGITGQSVIYAPDLAGKGFWLEVTDSLYSPIAQGMVKIDDDDDSNEFMNFILSESGRQILRDFGYGLP